MRWRSEAGQAPAEAFVNMTILTGLAVRADHLGIALRTAFACAALFLAQAASAQRLPLERIKLPPGFEISVFADGVPAARSLALGKNNVLFVGTQADRVHAVRYRGAKATRVITLASGLNIPNGVALRGGALYVGEVNRILRFDDIETQLDAPPKPAVVTDRYPRETHHGLKFIRFGPDGRLYVPVGAPCNVCDPDPARYALISRIRPDASGYEAFGRGAWSRSKKSGYRVARVVVEGGRVLKHEVFAEGWLQGEAVWGRPGDIEVMPDGSLLVSDDHAGAIYRIAYRGR